MAGWHRVRVRPVVLKVEVKKLELSRPDAATLHYHSRRNSSQT